MAGSWSDDFLSLQERCGAEERVLWVTSEERGEGALWRGEASPTLAAARRRGDRGPGLIAVWLGQAGWVDAIPTPIDPGAFREAILWANLAAQARVEGGAAALARYHHRRMEDLFIQWCDELCAARRGPLARQALAELRETLRLAPALERLTAGHDQALWARLDRAGGPHASRRLGARWRLHHAFLKRGQVELAELLEASG